MESNLSIELSNLKSLVKNMLEEVPKTRNSDKLLTLMIWRKHYSHVFIKQNKTYYVSCTAILEELPQEDNVKRIRAKFNEKGLYAATDPVVLERRNKSKIWKKSLGYATEKGEPKTLF